MEIEEFTRIFMVYGAVVVMMAAWLIGGAVILHYQNKEDDKI